MNVLFSSQFNLIAINELNKEETAVDISTTLKTKRERSNLTLGPYSPLEWSWFFIYLLWVSSRSLLSLISWELIKLTLVI